MQSTTPTWFKECGDGEQAKWLAGVQVPLDRFALVEPPVTLAEMRAHASQLLSIRASLESKYGDPVHFPWIPYGQDPIRPAQTYLAKLPRAALALFPRLEAIVAAAAGAPVGTVPPTLDGDAAEEATAALAGKQRLARGQGRQIDQATKAAIEAHSMNAAIEHFASRGDVTDIHGNESYDLRCVIGGEEWRIEVKGTTTAGEEVLLTPNEVEHANVFARMVLYVLSGIVVERLEDGEVRPSGGSARIYQPWRPEPDALTPTGYRYRLPPST